MKAHAVLARNYGDSDIQTYENVEIGEPGVGQVLLRQTTVGVNFLDIYHRRGEIKPASGLPFINGFEGVGIVEAVGPDVSEPNITVGARVGYTLAIGAYATHRLVPAGRIVVLPDDISDVQAAAILLKGTTAEYLVRKVFPVQRGDKVLVHAAAGGVGLILTQWAKHLGATVIGTVGSEAKAKLAREVGRCDEVFLTGEQPVRWDERIRSVYGANSIAVVYDGVAGPTFKPSLDLLRVRGMAVVLGNAGGSAPLIDVHSLKARSLIVTSPSLPHFTFDKKSLTESTEALFEVVRAGAVTIPDVHTYALADAARAHAEIEARRTNGPVVLVTSAS
ncbi:quinone oxidoreductase [Burkholderia sp. THE68]|uniref:quinone oxidoreductase family protein n=1 Tax=Burkholderia sp. THE68 TaxID=758782 RepID=UPI0013173ADD|nr:quinone oxidoreductase [Burkholderia sp. THE68]